MIIDGKQIAEEVLEKSKKEIQERNLNLSLAGILVGDDPEFKKFVELKGKAAEKIGVHFQISQFPAEIQEEDLIAEIESIRDVDDGALIELPLPNHLNTQTVLDAVGYDKDVDVLTTERQKDFYSNKSNILPSSVEALNILFENLKIYPAGKMVAVFGYGALIGKPIAHWLERQGAIVSVIRSKTENPAQISRQADIVISGVGKPDLITGDMVKEGVIVVDFGYGKKDGKMKGDVDFDSVSSKASLITPVPGGMGPILIAAVLKNLIKLNL